MLAFQQFGIIAALLTLGLVGGVALVVTAAALAAVYLIFREVILE